MKMPTLFAEQMSVMSLFVIVLIFSSSSVSLADVAKFESAAVCKECHEEIYQNWRRSLHALSYTNSIFTIAYQKAYTQTKGQAKQYCLNCHAPIAKISGDADAEQSITREGVTCDFCHSVAVVNLKNHANPFTVDPGGPVRSSLKSGGEGAEHKTVMTKDFASSKLCAGCHDFINRHGVHVGATYTEWSKSDYAKKGIECQDCHMKELEAIKASDGVKWVVAKKFPDHSLGRNLSSLRNAVTIKISEAFAQRKRVSVTVMVTNALIGHNAPTGTPMRRLVLEVSTIDANQNVVESQKRFYGKTVLGDDGVELFSDGEVFLHGKKVASDNRLKAKETRKEKFVFSKRATSVKSVTADVYFLYQPEVVEQTDMRIPLSSADKTLP